MNHTTLSANASIVKSFFLRMAIFVMKILGMACEEKGENRDKRKQYLFARSYYLDTSISTGIRTCYSKRCKDRAQIQRNTDVLGHRGLHLKKKRSF